MENNNKESFKLLGVSASGTDSPSDVPEIVLAPPRKKRIKSRRLRGNSASRGRKTQSCNCQGRIIGLSLAAVLLLCWLVTVTWLAVVLHGELKRLDNYVHSVAAGSQGVPEELQKCHSLSKELQQNQTLLLRNLTALSLQLENFNAQLSGVQAGLHVVEERLKATPELVNLPQDVQSLLTSVASFGSQIRDLNTTVTVLKNENSQLHEASKTLFDNVTYIKQRLVQLVNTTQQSQIPSTEDHAEKEEMKSVMRQLSTNITLVNDTLSKKLQWLAEDEGKDHKSVIGLEDLSQNVSARLTTLEGSCVKSAVHSALNNTVGNLSLQVTNGEKELSKLSGKVTELQTQVNHLERNETLLLSQISRIISKPSLDIPASSEAVSSLQLQTTEGTEVSGDDSPSQSAFN
ncbi:hypothetical protein B7P43_G06473 [Cryptotermes secundus]|uniref:EF-hand domain-containing protein n=1 Tax=Cryptotermes secundus TaxID=105785 RepID=A0A2J7RN07_9NEOP|nr:uncharacterized protein LOC111868966 isoform X2 [Cryptotermes secundus]XP_033609169.1 uncharacterized protein LOC111868966 isoform X2 [Cryptotermes secundus]PNF42221.1 hypothetical protein B7P43_G06473 [Cryptotermes secundus]